MTVDTARWIVVVGNALVVGLLAWALTMQLRRLRRLLKKHKPGR